MDIVAGKVWFMLSTCRKDVGFSAPKANPLRMGSCSYWYNTTNGISYCSYHCVWSAEEFFFFFVFFCCVGSMGKKLIFHLSFKKQKSALKLRDSLSDSFQLPDLTGRQMPKNKHTIFLISIQSIKWLDILLFRNHSPYFFSDAMWEKEPSRLKAGFVAVNQFSDLLRVSLRVAIRVNLMVGYIDLFTQLCFWLFDVA